MSEVRAHSTDRWGIACTDCPGGWWRDVEGDPITYGSRLKAGRRKRVHDSQEHRAADQPLSDPE